MKRIWFEFLLFFFVHVEYFKICDCIRSSFSSNYPARETNFLLLLFASCKACRLFGNALLQRTHYSVSIEHNSVYYFCIQFCWWFLCCRIVCGILIRFTFIWRQMHHNFDQNRQTTSTCVNSKGTNQKRNSHRKFIVFLCIHNSLLCLSFGLVFSFLFFSLVFVCRKFRFFHSGPNNIAIAQHRNIEFLCVRTVSQSNSHSLSFCWVTVTVQI